MECALVVQAVAVAEFGPLAPLRIETYPEARFTIVAGMKTGKIRRGPCSRSVWCSRSITSKPPIPLPDIHPDLLGDLGSKPSTRIRVVSRPQSAAAMATWIKRPIFLSFVLFDVPGRIEAFDFSRDAAREGGRIELGNWSRYALPCSDRFPGRFCPDP